MLPVVLAVLAIALSACVTVFPEAEPARLYRFEGQQPENAPVPGAGRIAVLKEPAVFPRSAGGDRILTVTGANVAYVAGARWVSPAAALFDEAVARAFQAAQGPARLTGAGDLGQPASALRLDMQTFEARYVNGPEAAPVVVVRLQASLQRYSDRSQIAQRMFAVEVPASENRVGAIVVAFDQAVTRVLGELITWVNGRLG